MSGDCVFKKLVDPESRPGNALNQTLEFKKLLRTVAAGCSSAGDGACLHMDLRRYHRGSTVVRDGDQELNFMVWLSGSALVFGSGPQGRQISLGRVKAGECCSIVTSSMMSGIPSPVTLVTEHESIVGTVSSSAFNHCMTTSAEFRGLVMRRCTEPLTELIELVKDVTFTPVNVRVAKRLLESAAIADENVEVTHQRLAHEVGSAREVISRELRKFKAKGWIDTGRKSVRVLNEGALREFVVQSG